MSGKRYLLDTNAIIALLNGNQKLNKILSSANLVSISIISQLEFFAFSKITVEQKNLFNLFAQRVEIINLTANQTQLIDSITNIRQQTSLKLPDAIIMASASIANSTLITADKQLLQHYKNSINIQN